MDEFLHILTSWPHWAFEFVSDMVLAVPAYIIGRLSVKRHDRRHHGLPKHKTVKAIHMVKANQ